MGNKILRHRAIVDERYTRPQGLYEHKNVDQKKLRRLILDAKLAPCYPGTEDQIIDLDECPICFLFYPSLNRSKCCSKCICTECLLQVKAAHSARSTQCPFCKMPNFTVEYRGAKTTEEKWIEQAEEQKVIEAKIRIRQRELKDEQEQVERQLENRKQGRFNIRPLLRQNFSSSRRCSNSEATVEMAPGAFERDFDSSPPLRTILEEGHPLIPEEEAATAEMVHGTFGRLLDSSPPVRTILEDEHPLIPEEEQHATLLPGRLMGRGWTLSQPADGSTSVRSQRENESGSSFIQPDRDYEFDLELEDIMVMEAIWLSIQEQNPEWQSSLSASSGYMTTSGFIDCALDMELSIHESDENIPPVSATEDARDMPVRSSVTGGLASALAVLAERQIQSIDSAGKDIAEVSSAYATPTRFSTHLDKDCIYKEGNEINSAFESDSEAEGREGLTCQESDGNDRLDSWIEMSLDSGRVFSTV